MNLQWEGLVHGPPIKQVDPTARNAAQFDSLSLSLSGTSLKSKEPDYFRLKPSPLSLSGCGTLGPRAELSDCILFTAKECVLHACTRL